MKGFFKVARRALKHDLWLERPYDRWHAWEYLFGKAAFGAHVADFMGRRIPLKRSQLATTVNQLAKDWGWSWDRVRRFLEYLKAGPRPMILVDRLTGRGTERGTRNETGKGPETPPATKTGKGPETPVIVVTICQHARYQGLPFATGKGTERGSDDETGKGTRNETGKGSRTETGNERRRDIREEGGEKGDASAPVPTPVASLPPKPVPDAVALIAETLRVLSVTGSDRQLLQYARAWCASADHGPERAVEILEANRTAIAGRDIFWIAKTFFAPAKKKPAAPPAAAVTPPTPVHQESDAERRAIALERITGMTPAEARSCLMFAAHGDPVVYEAYKAKALEDGKPLPAIVPGPTSVTAEDEAVRREKLLKDAGVKR